MHDELSFSERLTNWTQTAVDQFFTKWGTCKLQELFVNPKLLGKCCAHFRIYWEMFLHTDGSANVEPQRSQ